ncbi:MAG: hypothetical protein NZ699_02800 [Roseiflexus sp.]|nr:hypothetical protein [Roseiflexus sp.]MCS7288042.1 hypothetical protein [Roseiflexus sp.]MDW8234611.1 hypothetical protein [Roseiflexaceae bacterium]
MLLDIHDSAEHRNVAASEQALVCIGAALAALALYRHNGAPTALLILPAFPPVRRRAHQRQIVIIGSITLALALPVKAALFCVTAIAIRHRSWRTAGLALSVAAQSMAWMMLLTVQDVWFQYPVYVVSLPT